MRNNLKLDINNIEDQKTFIQDFINHQLTHIKYHARHNTINKNLSREDVIKRNLEIYTESKLTSKTYKELSEQFSLNKDSISRVVYKTQRDIESFKRYRFMMNNIER